MAKHGHKVNVFESRKGTDDPEIFSSCFSEEILKYPGNNLSQSVGIFPKLFSRHQNAKGFSRTEHQFSVVCQRNRSSERRWSGSNGNDSFEGLYTCTRFHACINICGLFTFCLVHIYVYIHLVRIYIYSTIYRHVFSCSTAHQCSLVQSGYGMATIYTQVIVSGNRLWDNRCHAHIQSA